jgi:NitT/TauT family transport system permease protein
MSNSSGALGSNEQAPGLQVVPVTIRRRRMRNLTNIGVFVFVYAGIILLWQIIVPLAEVPKYVLPTPTEIIAALWNGFANEGLAFDLYVTASEMLAGLVIAVVLGVSLAALIEEFPLVRRLVYPALVVFQSIPKMAVAPLILIWVGLGIESKIVLSALVAFFPLLVNSMSGFASYERDAADLFKTLHASRFEVFRRLKLRAFLPMFFSGLKVGFVFALLGAIVGEFLASSAGLGHAIIQMQFQLNVAGVFAVLVVLAVIGTVGERLISLAESRFTRWRGRG